MAILLVRLSIAKTRALYPFYELMSRLVGGEETAKKKSILNCSYRDRAVAAVAAYVYLQNQTSTGGVALDFWAPFSEDSVVALWNNVTSAYSNATGNTVRVSIYSGDEFFTKITIASEAVRLQTYPPARANGIINAPVYCARGSDICTVIVDGKVILNEGQ